jgi:hypothetical protein
MQYYLTPYLVRIHVVSFPSAEPQLFRAKYLIMNAVFVSRV